MGEEDWDLILGFNVKHGFFAHSLMGYSANMVKKENSICISEIANNNLSGQSLYCKCSRARRGQQTLTYLISKETFRTNNLLKYVFSNMRVHCRQWIVHQINIWVTVNCSSQWDSLLLSSRQIDSLQSQSINTNDLLNTMPICIVSCI